MSTLVVGAGGVLGRLLVDRLGARGVERRHGDEVLGGEDPDVSVVDTVINLGGPRVRPNLGWSDYLREHVGITSRVARHMRPGSHLVHVSSASVFGARPEVLPPGAAEAPSLFPNPSYAWAKLCGELAARAIARERGVRLSVLRLPVVYGPGVSSAIDTLLKAARRGMRLDLTPHAMRQHLLHSDLLVAAVRRLESEGPRSESPLVIADPFVLTNGDLWKAISTRGWSGVRIPLPLGQITRGLRLWPGFPDRDVPMSVAALGVFALDVAFEWRPTFDALGIDPEAFARDKTFDAYVKAWS